MGFLSATTAYDRTRILEAAAKAHTRKRWRKAIALYRRVLAVEPANAELHAKVAPLLARRRQRFDAWLSFRAAAQGMLREGNPERAVAIFTEATHYVPDEIEAWTSLAKLQRNQGNSHAAVKTLLNGVRRFRSRKHRAQAVYLLRQAREIDAWKFEAVIELAPRLAKLEQCDEAMMLLTTLGTRISGSRLRRVRSVQWRILPSLANTGLLIAAWFSTGAPPRAARPGNAGIRVTGSRR